MRKGRIILFSVIETVTNAAALIVWLQEPEGGLVTPNKVLAYAIWIAGFILEHVIAFNTGRDYPLLKDPDQV